MVKCIIAGCKKRASYGPDVEPPKAVHCTEHREQDEVGCADKRCAFPGCKTRPCYGKLGTTESEFCECHKPADYVDVKHKQCEYPGCKKRPTYNQPGTKTGRRCKEHQLPDDVDVKHKHCEHSGCKKRPTFGQPGTRTGVRCKAHRRPDDEDVTNKRCEYQGCKKVPVYGKSGTRVGKRCKDHKRPDDEDVVNKRCEYPGCKTQPTYGEPGTKTKKRCKEHKREDDEDVTSRRCEHPGCKKIPNYGEPGTKTGRRCVTHKREGDENVKCKHCEHPGCKKQPTFNAPGSTKGQYCLAHKRPGDEDVVTKRCDHPDCKKIATMGPLYAQAIHCASHRQPGEFPRRHPTCAIPGCEERPSWTIRGDNYPTHCETHARQIIDDAQNPAPAAPIAASAADAPEVAPIIIPREIASLQCAICANIRPCDRATGLCAPCAGLSQPRAWHKKREERMAQVLDAQKLIPTSADTRLEDSAACNVKSRPDFVFKRAGYTLIIEVDERQHARAFTRAIPADSTASYSCDCELARMIGIHQTLGEPTIFIRYNPDAYVDARGREQPACADTARDIQLVKHVMRMMRELDKAPPPDGLYAAYFFYDGMRANHGTTLQPDRFIIDYIDQSVNPWV